MSNILPSDINELVVDVETNNPTRTKCLADRYSYVTYITADIENMFAGKPFRLEVFKAQIVSLAWISISVVLVVVPMLKSSLVFALDWY